MLAALTLVVAFALTALSSFIEREGPELESYGNLCGPAANENCYRPALKGGFPFAYLLDSPGVSIEGKLSFGEDALQPMALVLDIAIYWVAFMLAILFAKYQSASRKHRTSRGEA